MDRRYVLLTGLFDAGAQNVLGTVIGALIFPDFRFHPLNVLGLALGMAGAVWYATEAALKVRDHYMAPQLVCRGSVELACSGAQWQQRVLPFFTASTVQVVPVSSLSCPAVTTRRLLADSRQCCLRSGRTLVGSGPCGSIPAKGRPAPGALKRACQEPRATSECPAANH